MPDQTRAGAAPGGAGIPGPGARIVLIGPPGAGKGTQAKLMEQRYGLAHVSAGDLLRRAVDEGSSLGKTAREYMNRGELVPDDLVIQLIEERVREGSCAKGFVLDGFPRNVEQARALDRMLEGLGLRVDYAISLEIPAEAVLERLGGRRSCPRCGQMYHMTFDPPPDDERCGRCGEGLVRREDDTADTIAARLEVYEEKTAPLKSYYADKNVLREVDGMGTREAVFGRIRQILENGRR